MLLLLVAALAALALAPSAQAMQYVPPSQPNPPECPVWPAPEPGEEGVLAEVDSILHTQTGGACSTEDDVEDIAGIGVTLVWNEANLVIRQVVGLVGPTVDGTQDNVCRAVYGDPNANQAACKEIILQFSA